MPAFHSRRIPWPDDRDVQPYTPIRKSSFLILMIFSIPMYASLCASFCEGIDRNPIPAASVIFSLAMSGILLSTSPLK